METIKIKDWNDLPENYSGIFECCNGDTGYCLNGKLHREDGPAITYPNSRKEYFINGKLHREDGPAIITSFGNRFYYVNGKLHIEDGPAIIRKNRIIYYLNGNDIIEEINEWIIENKIPKNHRKWNNSHKILFKLTFG